MKNRIKQIRKDADNGKGYSQEIFAKKLGLSRNMIAQVETGTNIFSERTLKDICREFNVNYEWLKSGTGPMYKPRSENQIIAEFVNDVMESKPDDFRKRLINALSQLNEDEWKVLEELAKKMQ